MSKTSIIAALTLLLTPVAAHAANYQPFPDGYGYMDPKEIAALTEAVAKGDHKTVRQHGWSLWAGIMQPSADPTWPIWNTWPNTFAAFAPSNALAATNGGGRPKLSMIGLNALAGTGALSGETPVNLKDTPFYPIPQPVKDKYKKATSDCVSPDNPQNICDGAHFLFNGDIMIPTESLSQEGFDWIRNPAAPLYEQSTLNQAHQKGEKDLPAPQRYIVTKHMYWPVKADRITAIPVWHDYHDGKYTKYAGFETWPVLVGVDPSGKSVGKTVKVSYLHGVFRPDQKTPWPTVTAEAKVHGLDEFYYHKVTQLEWDSFDEADKAVLSAASYWTYGELFGPGDYLVTIANHVNTKEIPTWALQSAWWSDEPNRGPYRPTARACRRPKDPGRITCWSTATASRPSPRAIRCRSPPIPISSS